MPDPRRAAAHAPQPPPAKATAALLAALAAAGGCADIPKDRYGVEAVRIRGMESLDERSLAGCLATKERDRLAINIGRSWNPECGDPPFDASRAHAGLWSWPWTEWPLYDRALFDRDLERIERWYKARGYYDARVLGVELDPPSAAESDRIEPEEGEPPPCARRDDDEGCKLAIEIAVEEGQPVHVADVSVSGIEPLRAEVRRSLREAMLLDVGDRWDEAFYDRSKRAMENALREASYACARVDGVVRVDPQAREARIEMKVQPGPPVRLGEIRIEGNEDLPAKPIRGAALLEEGDVYSESALDDAQRAIYNLGAFSAVRIEPQLTAQHCPTRKPDDANGEDEEEAEEEAQAVAGPRAEAVRVPVVVTVTPGRRIRFGVGAGVQSGAVRTAFQESDVRQWDVHLLAVFEHRNLFGGLRRLRIEERPRLIFSDIFPKTTDPQPGNLAVVEFRQPAFLEPRTTLVATARWDLGPEPFGGRFNRHDVDARLGLERGFLDGHVFLSGGIHDNVFRVTTSRLPSEDQGTRDYHLLFFEQYANLDLRDDPRRPTRGAFFSVGLQEAGYILPSSWDYVRITPEARAYVPLPLGLVLAFRFGVGAIFITDASEELIPSAQQLGPERYRLRGGGPSSNRGFVPGDLGEGIEGGRRRWEASAELRVPLSESLGLAFFADFGDVSFERTFRFDHWHPSVGAGLRYNTVVGPLRLDVGYRVPKIQVLGGPDPDPRFEVDLGFVTFPGAVHLTIGESF
ncbi:MAG: BamA/OMP85 family outer membrane protein [Myxococcota bacterium]